MSIAHCSTLPGPARPTAKHHAVTQRPPQGQLGASWRARLHVQAVRCCPASSSSSNDSYAPAQQQAEVPACSRRVALSAAGLLLLSGGAVPEQPAFAAEGAEELAASAARVEFVAYTSESQGYSLEWPATWEQVGKAGADALFRDPQRKSTTVGVTVYPVTISSLEEFGSLEAVGRRLLDAERAKESTLGVEMVSQRQRRNAGAAGGTVYDFSYRLDSTRGAKQIFSSVTVAGKKLYILNGNLNCPKDETGGGVCLADGVAVLERVTASFRGERAAVVQDVLHKLPGALAAVRFQLLLGGEVLDGQALARAMQQEQLLAGGASGTGPSTGR